jgi:hypothetical protein
LGGELLGCTSYASRMWLFTKVSKQVDTPKVHH